MNIYGPLSHTVSIEVNRPAVEVFDFLSDPRKTGRWALGCFDIQPAGKEGLYKGTSLFDASESWVRIVTDEKRLIIDYHVGDPDNQLPRIFTRIMPGSTYGSDSTHSIVCMTAVRTKDMSDSRWYRLCATHDTEIFLIQSQIENQLVME